MSRLAVTSAGSAASAKDKKTRAPLSGVADVALSDPKRWKVLYPAYFNAHKSLAEGRRVPARLAVERPSVHDIAEVCQALSLPFAVENKTYCRDYGVPGRVRVMVKRDDGSPLVAGVVNKQQLLLRVAAAFPALKNRAIRLEVDRKREEKETKELMQLMGMGGAAAAAPPANQQTAATGAAPEAAGGDKRNNNNNNKKKKKR